MSLALIAPRRFRERALPAYPTILALAVAAASCDGRTPSTAPGHVVQVPAVPATAQPGTRVATSAKPAAEPLRFAADDQALDMNVGCKGDCPSPYQMASARKDEAQIQERAEYCAREQKVQRVAAILRAKVGSDGRAKDLLFESPEGDLTEPLRSCLVELASKAVFTPPEKGLSDRLMFARFHVPRAR